MKTLKRILCGLALTFSMLFVSVGYATITNDFEIKGLVSVSIPNKVFLTSAINTSSQNATSNTINYTSTVLNTTSIFNPVDGNSQIGIELTFYNGSDLIYEYDQEVVQTHSNNQVTYTVTNLIGGQIVEPKTYVTAYIFFSSPVTTTVTSIIDFHFVVANTEDNVGLANHESLIDAMINDTTNGLNTENSYLNRQIESRSNGSFLVPSRDTLGSMAVTQGNSLESMFGDSYATTEEIAFLLQFIDTNNDDVIDYYYLFTTSVALGPNGAPSIARGEQIYAIYRTKIVYDNEEGAWVREEIVEGYAESQYYEESQPFWNIHVTQIPSFDPDTWVEGRLGTSIDNAIWTSINQDSLICSEALNNQEKRYYQVNIPANGNYSIIIDGDNETNVDTVLFELYDSNRTLIDSSYASLDFPITNSDTKYYFAMSGSTTMDFKFVAN